MIVATLPGRNHLGFLPLFGKRGECQGSNSDSWEYPLSWKYIPRSVGLFYEFPAVKINIYDFCDLYFLWSEFYSRWLMQIKYANLFSLGIGGVRGPVFIRKFLPVSEN